MKICLIGNSHIAAIKLGWLNVAGEFPDVQLTFFAARFVEMAGLMAQGDRLVADTASLAAQISFISGGLEEIIPKDYDMIVLCGLGLFVPRLPAGTSAALRRQASIDYVNSSLIPVTLQKLHSVTDKTIWVAPSPMSAVAVADEQIRSAMVPYFALINDVQIALDDPRCKVIGQPSRTLTRNLASRSVYTDGSVKLPIPNVNPAALKHPPSELKHMNGAFGAIWLKLNLPKLIAA